MPVEIRELHIRVNVNQPPQQGSAPAPGASGEDDKESLPAQLLDEILEVIKNKDER